MTVFPTNNDHCHKCVISSPNAKQRINVIVQNEPLTFISGLVICVRFLVSLHCVLTAVCRSVCNWKRLKCVRPKSWNLPFDLLLTLIRSFVYQHAHDLVALRAATDFPFLPRVPRPVVFDRQFIGNVGCEVIVPTRAVPVGGIVLYLHGGGFGLCSPKTHRPLTQSICVLTNCIVVCPQYRRVPEHTVMDAVSDCLSVYDDLLNIFGRDKNICIAGDSAGGALAVLLINSLCASGRLLEKLACGVLMSPWCDIRSPHASSNDHDYINTEILGLMSVLALKRSCPSVCINPIELTGDEMSKFPPLLIHCGEWELLRNQICMFVRKISHFNTNVIFKEYSECVHVPHMFATLNKHGHDALLDACEYIRMHI